MSIVRTLIGNVKGPQGNTGATGARGPAGTVEVGSVQTVSYGSPASVTNSGTEEEAILDFQIPQGAPGATVTDMSGLVLSSITDSTAEYPAFAVQETGATIFGKIRKYLSDLFNNTVKTGQVTTSTNVDTAGFVADARAISALNTSLTNLKNGTDSFTTVSLGAATLVSSQNGYVQAQNGLIGNNKTVQSQAYLPDKYGSLSSRYRTRASENDEWGNWSSYGYFYPLKHKDISGTTDSNGFINLNLDNDKTLPILGSTRHGGSSLSDRYVEFTPGAGSWWARVTYRGNAVASTSIQFRVWYFDAPNGLV